MLTPRAVVLALLLTSLAVPAAAHAAGEPIMPLDQVHKGMHCTGSSVIQGTDISTFKVDVIDVVAGDPAASQPYILIQVSGPAVDATGIGPGFSGSPVRCPAANGTMEIAGAISEGIGQYGNKQALATPIQSVLGEPVDAPAGIRSEPAMVARAKPFATPLSVSGLSPAVASLVQRSAAKVGRVIYAAPPAPPQTAFPVQQLVPGASMATGLSSGDITTGAIGTVTYVDGSSVWGFGHPLDSVGRRTLFLQDAYVYSVVNNPIGSADLQTYKYAAIGHDVGELTDDGISGVAGRLGAVPPSFPLKVTAQDLDTKRTMAANMRIADETAIGLPTGSSSLAQVGAIAVAQAAYEIIDGAPANQSGSMCVSFSVKESTKQLRFCNRHVGGGGGEQSVGGGPLVADFADAAGQLDAFKFGPLHITGAQIDIKLSRSLNQAFLFSASGPQLVRRGSDIRVRLRSQRVNGPRLSRYVKVHIPRGMPAGPRVLTFTGTSSDMSDSSGDSLSLTLGDLLGSSGGSGGSSDEAGPRNVAQLRRSIAAVHREYGVTASFQPPGGSGDGGPASGPEAVAQKDRQVLRDKNLRFSGTAKLRVFVG